MLLVHLIEAVEQRARALRLALKVRRSDGRGAEAAAEGLALALEGRLRLLPGDVGVLLLRDVVEKGV